MISKEHLVKTLDLRVENGEDMDQALKPWIKKQSKSVDWLRVVKSQIPRSSGGDLILDIDLQGVGVFLNYIMRVSLPH